MLWWQGDHGGGDGGAGPCQMWRGPAVLAVGAGAMLVLTRKKKKLLFFLRLDINDQKTNRKVTEN